MEYVREQLREREDKREQRDREFWRVMFGGEPDADFEFDGPTQPQLPSVLPESDDEVIARSMLGRR